MHMQIIGNGEIAKAMRCEIGALLSGYCYNILTTRGLYSATKTMAKTEEAIEFNNGQNRSFTNENSSF